jgi:hypothetical protein
MDISRLSLQEIPAVWGETAYPRRSLSPSRLASGLDASLSHQAGIQVLKIFHEINGAVPVEQLQELAATGLLEQIPRREDGELGSIGSIYHHTGECSPCTYWFRSSSSCKHSVGCRFCHFVHPGQKSKRSRPSKHTRMRFKKRMEREAALEDLNDIVSNDALNNDGSSNDGKASSSNGKASSSNGKASSSSNGKASSSTDEGKDSSNGSSSNGKTSSSYGKASSSTDKAYPEGMPARDKGTPPGSSNGGRQSTVDDTPPGSSNGGRQSTPDDTYDDTPPGSSAAGSSTRVSENAKVAKSSPGRGNRHFMVEEDGSITHL